jgi:DNA polymerase kappa
VQIPGIGKVTEQTLQALGVSTCSDLIKQAALLTALLSDISSSSLIHAGLGLGATEHSSRGGGAGSSEPGRKGISCERTFSAMSSTAEMEQMVSC